MNYKETDAENREHKVEKIERPTRPEFALVLYKPLYGTRDAPMRWYCRIAQALIDNRFFPLKCDRCTFARYRPLEPSERGYAPNARRIITSYVLIRVDDVVFSGTSEDYNDIVKTMSTFDHDPWEELKEGKR